MKKIFLLLLAMSLSALSFSQNANDNVLRQGASNRKVKTEKKLNDDKAKYWTGKVPVKDGIVTFQKKITTKGVSQETLMKKAQQFAENLIEQSQKTEISQITVADAQQGKVIASMAEEMAFKLRAWEKDVTDFFYQMTIDVQENTVLLTINNLSYRYEAERETGGSYLKAEDWITDSQAFNKSKTKFLKEPGKFRRATIDRVNAIFQEAEAQF